MPSRPTPSRPSPSSKRVAARLDEQLCFALYAAANAIVRAYAPLLRPHGLTYLQYLVLLVLWERDDRSVGEIGRALFLDSGTLTPVLRRLEGQGILTRRRSEHDEREVRIGLSEAGRRLEGDLDEVRVKLGCRMTLSLAALTALRDELRDLREQLAASHPGAA